MIIKSMTASFGKLRGETLVLKEGFNLIEAPNEGGKSTWCAFLRAMLYGIPTRERDRQGYLAEKNRYQPWSGQPMEGEMNLSWRGKDITLRRGPRGSAPFGAFTAVYTGSEEPVPGLTAENCGELLLGVSRAVFERSAFVGQGGAAIGADGELERRIAALVSSGEEEVSYTEVEGRLREWQRRRKYNKSGLVPKLEAERADLAERLKSQERARGQAEEAVGEIDTLTAQRTALTAALEYHRRRENRARQERYRAALEALKAAQNEAEALRALAVRLPAGERLRQAQGDLSYHKTLEANLRLAESQLPAARTEAEGLEEAANRGVFAGMSPEEAWRQAGRDRDRATEKPPKGALLGTVMIFLAAGVGMFLAAPYMAVIAAVAGALVLGLSLAFSLQKRKFLNETAVILKKYGAQYPDDILTQADAYRERHVAAREGARKLEQLQAAIKDLQRQKEDLYGALLDLAHTFEPQVTDLFGVSAALSRGLSVRERLAAALARLEGAKALVDNLPVPEDMGDNAEAGAGVSIGPSPEVLTARLAAVEGELERRKQDLARATGELGTFGDSAELEAGWEALGEELVKRREEHDALTLALEALNAANADLRARFSPALNASAGEILSALTGGKYAKVGLDRQFEASALETGSALPRPALALSQGTAEQVYLAVRLAVCKLALPTEEPAPIILDDALDAFDDTRMALALDYLRILAEERQILLFTCHSREGKYLAISGR